MSGVATVIFWEVAGVTPPGSQCRGVAGVANPSREALEIEIFKEKHWRN